MSDRDHPSGVPSNTELAQRLARVEEGVDRQSEHIERLADTIEQDLENKRERLDAVETRNQTLWYAYNAGKWILAVGSGGGALALIVQALV